MAAVVELDPAELDVMLRTVNRELMVAWINAELLERAWGDVRKSYVLYDENREFLWAMQEKPDEALLAKLGERTPIRFWSKGVE